MSDELQAEVDRLKALNDKLAKQLVDAHDDLKEVRGEARDRRHENKSLSQQVADLTTERDGYKVKAEATSADWQTKIDGLTGQLRGLKHEKAYEAAARDLKVTDPAKLADLVKLAGYSPDSDEPDAEKIKATFGEALKGRSWLVDQPAPDGAPAAPGGAPVATAPAAPAVPGPGADRGQSASAPSPSQPAASPAGRF